MRKIDDGPLPKDFPLSEASSGQYAKKFQGKRYYFGAINFGWKSALEKWHHDWPFILQGKLPPAMPVNGVDAASLEFIATEFIKREHKRSNRHALKGGSFIEIRNTIEIACTHVGKKLNPLHILPDDWADLRDALGYIWKQPADPLDEGQPGKWIKTETRIGPAMLKRRIIHVRAMFRWAGPEGAKLLQCLPNYGDGFKLVSDKTVKKATLHRERQHGAKRWEVSQVMPIFNACDEQLQAMFLLSINVGFTAADCSALPWSAVDLDKGLIDFARVKTGVERLKLMLWPETVQALKHVKALNLKPAPGFADFIVHQDRGDAGEAVGQPIALKDCVFITSKGRPWVVRKITNDVNGLPVSESHKDSIALEFNKALHALKIKRDRVGFGAGRHTFETHALRVADKSLVDAVMGHSTGAMSQHYDHATDGDVLQLFKDVRARLLPDAKQWGESGAALTPGTMRLTG